ncbi:hypothetical protein PQE68_gp232 [Bacillus phage vB_BanS_Sophrita]|uniref:Uncharacterized protein n=1 Tax=Bacillus phage vB_BanS_Sophrita TaxID=2894790 RepID=A0AAE9CDK2_9CAUD|nr:hypothetical protein PQE68_gp232 [Bacillus phage vB_BanS_Sophrita]UGO50850.1 hypothetical protein SOPHRITA_263 [Bacillus phage vB_BanS_Sophrita]
MMNETMLELMRKGFSVYIGIEEDGFCVSLIKNVKLDKSAKGISYTPEKSLAKAMLEYIDNHGRIE